MARATAPGTLAALPSLFAPEEHRQTLGVAFALRGEIGRSLAPDLAPEVAATRLSWWGEEAGQVVAGHPRHPLTRYLSSLVQRSALVDDRMVGSLVAEMVGAAQATLAEPVPASWSALLHRLEHDWGALCRLLSRGLSHADQEDEGSWHGDWGNALGCACAIEEALSSTEEADLPALSPATTATDEQRAASWREFAVASLARATQGLPAESRGTQRPLLVLAALVARRLAAPDSAKERHLAVSLGELWCAWRAAQHAARGQLPGPLRGIAAVDFGS